MTNMKFRSVFTLVVALLLPFSSASAQTVKVFILAGQSNMEGQAVVGLKGKDYNNGKGTLALLAADPRTAAGVRHLITPEGKGKPRDDVWVRYQRENRPLLAGALDFGFSVYGDAHHFGPELQFGHVVGDALDEPVLLIKTAWGGKSLYQDFRPPSSGGEVGKYYQLMIAQVRDALAEMPTDFPALKGHKPVLAGLVWYQGWNDGVNPKVAIPQYEENLANLIRDVRRDLATPRLPVVIGELTGAWVQAPPEWERLRAAQAATARRAEFKNTVAFAPTRHFVREAKDSPNPTHGHHEFGNAETYVLVGDALAKAMLTLLPQKKSAAGLRLPAMFADHMVLQRDLPVPVWGWSDADAKVSVQIGGQTQSTAADQNGRWSLRLEPLKASQEAQTLFVSAGDARLLIRNVLVSEVWLCAGQSNMAMTIAGKTEWLHIGGIADADKVVQDSTNPLLRQFLVDWKTNTKPQETCTGRWSIAAPDTSADFSATGYFFARELQQRLGVPVGILNASFGGSSVEGWTSREALAKESDAEFVAQMEKEISDYEHHDQRVADYVAAVGAWEQQQDCADPNGSTDDARWAAPSASTTDWQTITLPAPLSKLGCAHGGVVWLRKEIEVPDEFGSAWRLDFPTCRAFYAVYLNGSKIFEATPANGLDTRPSRPTPGKGIAKTGKNTLAIKLHTHAGASGITGGAFAMVPFNPKHPAVPLCGEWLFKVEKAFTSLPKGAAPMPRAPVKGTLHWMPVPSQFNAMLHPLIPFGMRGVIWYQGESNVGNARYSKHLKILINDWRRRWNTGDFPFYLCQLPGFGERQTQPADSRWAECREMQTTALDLPNTALANLIDTCEDGDLHPLNKQDAGHRLALIALAKTYGVKDQAWSGPVFDSMQIAEGKAIIRFKHADNGLVARPLPATYHPNLRKPELTLKPLPHPSPDSELQGFTICDASNQWVNAQAKIDGSKVIVWSPAVRQPVAVRYAWADHPICNLYNAQGLPAFPFMTDGAQSRPD
jgi:sialate O-acetylesterase